MNTVTPYQIALNLAFMRAQLSGNHYFAAALAQELERTRTP